jgi:NADH:ubiquinone oxidoreductase subunit E
LDVVFRIQLTDGCCIFLLKEVVLFSPRARQAEIASASGLGTLHSIYMTSAPAFHSTVILPGLQRIQREFGFLKREALERFSRESAIPLYRLQAVASFFPHFRLHPPAKVTVHVCRDMACHLAGSAEILQELGKSAGEQQSIHGASCLGRCDRAPAACVSVHGAGGEHEAYFLGRRRRS